MLSNFYNGVDPHTASAYAIWGEENYNKAKRKKAKIFNKTFTLPTSSIIQTNYNVYFAIIISYNHWYVNKTWSIESI